MGESVFVADPFVVGKLIGRRVPQYRQMFRRRPQVLPQGQNIDLMLAQVAHDGQHLVASLAQAEHQSRFRWDKRPHTLSVRKHFERPIVTRAEPHLPVQARDCLDVVIEHIRVGIHDDLHGGVRALEIGH